MTADVSKMFRQIEINPEHWDLQRILWRENQNEPIRDYWLTVVTYGLKSSPYLAVKTLIQCALDNEKEFPEAARIVKEDFYMDDMLNSFETKTEAERLKAAVITLLSKGGFELTKWRSNNSQIVEEETGE